MEKVPVQSSNVAAVGYDQTSGILEVDFLSGATYQYYGVPEEVYTGLLGAPSKGRFLDQFVKKAGYHYDRVR